MTKRSGMVVGLVLFCCFLVGFWLVVSPRKYETKGVLALDQAQKVCPIPLPISATNIWIATYYHFQALGEYVRFEAPAEDCKEHVRSILTQHRERFEHLRGHFDEGEWREITPTNRPQIAIVGFRNGLSWFDVEHITNGVTMGGGPCIPQFWVDYDRGIFYYCLTD